MLPHHCCHKRERETSANPFGIYHPKRESSETSLSHFRSGTRKPQRDVKTRENQVETGVLCKNLFQIEKKFYLSIEIYASSFKCGPTELFEEKVLLKQNCLKPVAIRGGFSRNKKIIHFLKGTQSWTGKN